MFTIVENFLGIDDEHVLSIAYEKKAILITQDKDFGELVYRLGKAHLGVVLLRLSGMDTDAKAELTVSVIAEHEKDITEAFTVFFHNYVKVGKKPV